MASEFISRTTNNKFRFILLDILFCMENPICCILNTERHSGCFLSHFVRPLYTWPYRAQGPVHVYLAHHVLYGMSYICFYGLVDKKDLSNS